MNSVSVTELLLSSVSLSRNLPRYIFRSDNVLVTNTIAFVKFYERKWHFEFHFQSDKILDKIFMRFQIRLDRPEILYLSSCLDKKYSSETCLSLCLSKRRFAEGDCNQHSTLLQVLVQTQRREPSHIGQNVCSISIYKQFPVTDRFFSRIFKLINFWRCTRPG